VATQLTDDGLSARERDVIRFVAKGKANKEIALLLGMSASTEKGHLESIFAKYHVSNRTEAAIEWFRRQGSAE
jgi:DNA-binding NarL/FixJ family response regulator